MAEINDETQKLLQAEKKRQEKDSVDLKSKLKTIVSEWRTLLHFQAYLTMIQ